MPVTILAYHGVTDKASTGIENFQGKHLTAEEFERQMRALKEQAGLLSLRDLVEAYAVGDDPDGVIVTFDDAYRNNVTVALPILERYQVPTTFFLSTGFIGMDRMFWVDEVEQAIDQTDAAVIDFTAAGLTCFALDTREARMLAVTEIKAHLKRVPEDEKNRLLALLKAAAMPRSGSVKSANYETMSWDDVRRLAESSIVELGGHTIDHAILSRLSEDQIREQVVRSKEQLEDETGCDITLFAYPNGGAADYTPASIEILKDSGYICACTTLPGVNTSETSVYELRRTMAGFCGEPFPFPLAPPAQARRS